MDMQAAQSGQYEICRTMPEFFCTPREQKVRKNSVEILFRNRLISALILPVDGYDPPTVVVVE